MTRLRVCRYLAVPAAVFIAATALAQTPPVSDVAEPAATVCLTLAKERDALPSRDRAAALLLLTRQFELAGRRVVADGCSVSYTLLHIRLGDTIVASVTGIAEYREGVARGLDDLPALYSQIVQSIVTGRPMTEFNVDRTKVTGRQPSTLRVESPSFSFWYVRLGYGSILGEDPRVGPAFGLGYRVEVRSLAVDVSFFNLQLTQHQGSSTGTAGSLLKIEPLLLMKPWANASAYAGGGISYGGTDLLNRSGGWHGSGLQGELTVGYEFVRDSSLRVFVQADATLPFYRATWRANGWQAIPAIGSQPLHAPVLTLSLGVGRQRGRR